MTEAFEWKISSDAWKQACHDMHRRAQKAEGELMRMKQAHAEAARHAFKTHIDYYTYGFMLLNCNKTLFPKKGFTGGACGQPVDKPR